MMASTVLSISGTAHGTGYGYGVDTQIDKILERAIIAAAAESGKAEKASAVARVLDIRPL